MADVVNLNKMRKARRREAERQLAAENRVVHGRPKAEKAAAQLEEERRRTRLDAQQLKGPDGSLGRIATEYGASCRRFLTTN